MYCKPGQTEAVAPLQAKRLLAPLQAARATPFYGRLLNGRDLSTLPLQALPVLSKTMLMQQFEQFVADPRLTLAGLQALCRDPQRVGERYLGRYTVWECSGSNGQPGIYVQDPAAMAVYENLEAACGCGSHLPLVEVRRAGATIC